MKRSEGLRSSQTGAQRMVGKGGHGLRDPKSEGSAVPTEPRFSGADLEVFRQLLLRKRVELAGDVDHMEQEALRKNRVDATGDLSMMPIHMADIGTDNYEQEFTIELISNEQTTLKEIDAALERIRKGSYGICEGTGKPIPKARLRVRPWARYRIEHKRHLEENGG